MVILDEIQTGIRQHAEGADSSVVGIGPRWGVGSGIVLTEGRVLTNAHIIRGDRVTVTFADGRTAEGSVQVMDDGIRVSDADRDGVTAQLRDHFAAGRITPGELDERLSAALNAKTFGDLRRIMTDLPGPVPAPLGAAPSAPRATPAWAVRRRPPFPPLILFALFAALLIPGTGWLLATLATVILLFWLTTVMAGAFAIGQSGRRRHHHGGWQRPRYGSERHYTWL